MRRIASCFAAILLAASISGSFVGGAAAHDLDEVERQLLEREMYVEIVEQSAPKFTLQTADGQDVSLSDLRGKVVVLWFIFAGCTDACPLQSQAIAEIQAQVNETPMSELVEFVAITTDPHSDTAEIMKTYEPKQGLDPENWMFLTSGPDRPEDATREIAHEYGLRFEPTEDGQQLHGVVTHLIDREGVMRARYHGLKFDDTNMIIHINALTHDHQHPEADDESFLRWMSSLLGW